MPFDRATQTKELHAAARRTLAGDHMVNGVNNAPWDKALMEARNDGGFHWQGDVYFKRLDDGYVRMRIFGDWNYTANWEDFVIDPASWASIVCSVSAGGETVDRRDAAQDFHGRPTSTTES